MVQMLNEDHGKFIYLSFDGPLDYISVSMVIQKYQLVKVSTDDFRTTGSAFR